MPIFNETVVIPYCAICSLPRSIHRYLRPTPNEGQTTFYYLYMERFVWSWYHIDRDHDKECYRFVDSHKLNFAEYCICTQSS